MTAFKVVLPANNVFSPDKVLKFKSLNAAKKYFNKLEYAQATLISSDGSVLDHRTI